LSLKILSKRFIKKLFLQIKSEENFDFSKHTTYGCGGIAKKAFFPKNTLEAICVFEKIIKTKTKFCILGNGSNVLASQKFFNGVVVCTKNFKGIFKKSNEKIYCLAGTTVQEIINFCKKNSLGGLEFLYKIPATIGGLALMNGGAGGIYLENFVIKIKIFNTKIRNLNKSECNFKYKRSTMQDIICLILGVELKIFASSTMQISKKLHLVAKNRFGLPKGRSCGCIFKNYFLDDIKSVNCAKNLPLNNNSTLNFIYAKDDLRLAKLNLHNKKFVEENKVRLGKFISAGQIIEECGLKGYKIGCAEVSNEHANFIINYGKNSFDVYNLIQFVKDEVYKKKGILLEEEVRYIGEF